MSLLEVGQKVQNYEIKKQLGAGGFGAVYEAVDCMLGRKVAIKVLSHQDHVVHRQRFRDEGRLLAKLQHPKIVQIYALGELEDGSSFLAMELFGKGSIQHYFPIGTPIDLRLAIKIIQDLLSALVAAHAQSIVHRDIKEGNLLYDPETECTKLCDFGIARSMEPLTDEAQSTAEGRVIGTCHYIAPERYKGIKDDPRSDLFAVGVVFYRLLSGHRPFEKYAKERPENIVVMQRVLNEDPNPLPTSVPNAISSICYQLLAKNLHVRFASAKDALDALCLAENTPQTESVSMSVSLDLKTQKLGNSHQETKDFILSQALSNLEHSNLEHSNLEHSNLEHSNSEHSNSELLKQQKVRKLNWQRGSVLIFTILSLLILSIYLWPTKPQVVKFESPQKIIMKNTEKQKSVLDELQKSKTRSPSQTNTSPSQINTSPSQTSISPSHAPNHLKTKEKPHSQQPVKKDSKASSTSPSKNSSVFIEPNLEGTP